MKDALERKLHRLVCAGELDLKTAQQEIASNWIEAYQKYIAKSPPAPAVRETPAASSTANGVWVNTRSGRYWRLVHRVVSRRRTAVGQLADFQGANDEHI